MICLKLGFFFPFKKVILFFLPHFLICKCVFFFLDFALILDDRV